MRLDLWNWDDDNGGGDTGGTSPYGFDWEALDLFHKHHHRRTLDQ